MKVRNYRVPYCFCVKGYFCSDDIGQHVQLTLHCLHCSSHAFLEMPTVWLHAYRKMTNLYVRVDHLVYESDDQLRHWRNADIEHNAYNNTVNSVHAADCIPCTTLETSVQYLCQVAAGRRSWCHWCFHRHWWSCHYIYEIEIEIEKCLFEKPQYKHKKDIRTIKAGYPKWTHRSIIHGL